LKVTGKQTSNFLLIYSVVARSELCHEIGYVDPISEVDSSVSIVTWLDSQQPLRQGTTPGSGKRVFSSLQRSYRPWGPVGTAVTSQRINRTQRETDYSVVKTKV
jgi:hypothetical protein